VACTYWGDLFFCTPCVRNGSDPGTMFYVAHEACK
jgi:hypothetical protein